MNYGYGTQTNIPQVSTNNNNQQQFFPNQPQQNIQPLFPQPQGNVYNINSTLEVANVPVGAGVSVALCLPENCMYIKTMQNGNPLFYPYKIIPYNNEAPSEVSPKPTEENPLNEIRDDLKSCIARISNIEEKIKEKDTKKKGDDWKL